MLMVTPTYHHHHHDRRRRRQDRQFFPVLVENARKGKSKYALGDGTNVADFTFVGNVAHAHLLAAEKVRGDCFLLGVGLCVGKGLWVVQPSQGTMNHSPTHPPDPHTPSINTPSTQLGAVDGVAGQAFFVTNDAPLPFWDFLAAVLTGFGYPAPRCARLLQCLTFDI